MRIATNVSAMATTRALNNANDKMSTSLEKLSSGLRVNSAADDAAGLAISEKMENQISGMDQASRNAEDGISLAQTVDGALDETYNILTRMRELAVQASNGTYTDEDRAEMELEFTELQGEIDQLATDTEFNTLNLMNSSSSSGTTFTFQVGANANQTISLNVKNMSTSGLNVSTTDMSITSTSGGVSMTSAAFQTKIASVISGLDAAISAVSNQQATLGAVENRLDYTIDNLETTSENLSSAKSQITDVDMASEYTEYSKQQILISTSTSMLSQATSNPQTILQLIQ